MFRLEYLNVKGHPQLGDLNISLAEKSEIQVAEKPYSSVIIGPNGTGKSFILRTIAEIFRQLEHYSKLETPSYNIPFDITMKYYIGENSYLINIARIPGKKRKNMSFLRNLPERNDFIFSNFKEEYAKYRISHSQLELPHRLIVNSIIPTDRFVWQNSNPTDFYQYLGMRSTRTTSSTQSSSRRTIKHIFNSVGDNQNFVSHLKELLKFLEFEESFKVDYKTKINALFFSGNLTEHNFRKYFEEWWDEDFHFSKRSKDNPLWSIPYYNNNFKNNAVALGEIVAFLNRISTSNRLTDIPRSRSKVLSIDLFDSGYSKRDLELIRHLENLDIINVDGLKLKKFKSSLSIDQISSGEYHLLISLIGIFANIKQSSLILIDEPEISLHPNWQMRYITFLKKVFHNYSSCHFILTTHSHFFISDLEGMSSSLTGLVKEINTELSKDRISTIRFDPDMNTFGWSAEEVLYTVFNVRSARNYYFEYDLTKLVSLINSGSNEYNEIRRILRKLSVLKLSEADPLNLMISKAWKYLKSKDA